MKRYTPVREAALLAEIAAERARAERAEENQSDAERIARVWMETAKNAEAELAEAQRERDRLREALRHAVLALARASESNVGCCAAYEAASAALEGKP
jgi:hypothetical protein